jgi:hypothetical protein
MAIQLTGLGQTAAVEVDPTFNALRVTQRNMESINWQCITTNTGNQTITAVFNNTTGAGTIYSLRNNGPNYIAIRRFQVGWRLSTGFTAAQTMQYGLVVARNHITPFIAGGTILYTTGALNTGRLDSKRHSAPPVSIITATTAGLTALTAGNLIFDANYLAYMNWWNSTTAGAYVNPNTALFEALPGEPCLVLKQAESVNLVNLLVMGAAGVGVATITVEFAEIPAMALSTYV